MFASDPPSLARAAGATLTPSAGLPGRDDLLSAIGHTPLLRLRRIAPAHGGEFELYGKAEFLNPSGSVKDRAAAEIVTQALERGEIAGSRGLLDASSGNTGVAYAMLGARLGFSVTLCIPANASRERLRRLEEFGATIVRTDPLDGTDGAQRVAREMAEREPARFFYADQYNNPANPAAHYRSTGPELWKQTHGRLTHLVVGVGTGGTISGTSRYLKEQAGSVRTLGVEPDGPIHGIEGLKHLPSALRPSTYEGRWVDETVRVSTEESEEMRLRLARLEGLHVGRSSGAAVAAAVRLAGTTVSAVVVAILPDSAHDPDPGARP